MVRGPQAIQKVWSCVLLSLLACSGVAAQTPAATATLRQPRLVPGIEDPYPWRPPASPGAMVALRDGVVYAAGRDLWASDGTRAGTRLLATLCAPSCTEIVALGHGEDLAFFAERTRDYRSITQHVVRTDGSAAGTFRVTGTLPLGYFDSSCPAAKMAGERLYFPVDTGQFSLDDRICTLWSSDGTKTGTAPLDPDVVVEGDLVSLGDGIYFLGTGHGTRGLWRASAGRVELVQAFQTQDTRLTHLTAAGGRLFFFGPPVSRGLWTSDGTASGTLMVTRFAVASGTQALLAGLGGRAWFVADDGRGEELWSSDGSVAGTRPATDFPDPHPFRAAPLTADKLAWLRSRLVFPALHRDRVSLWSTSGNRPGAQTVQGCPGGCPVVAPLPLAVLGRRAVFVGLSHGAPAELWVTDGSGPGTQRLRSARGFSGLVAVGGGVLFLERDEEGLFVGATDGTPAGTAGRLAAADPARESLAAAVAALGGRLFFPALDPDPDGGGALWAVRPRATAAQEVFLPPPHAAQPGDAPGFTFGDSLALLGRAGGRALAWTCDDGQGLYATDSWQVEPLLDPDDGSRGCENVQAFPAGDGAIVEATEYSDARGDASVLWATDGTRPGTFRIPVSTHANVIGPVPLADRAVFLADDFTDDGPKTRLWHSDGSAAGTAMEVEVSLESGTGWDGMASDGSRACFFDRRFDSLGGPTQRQLWCSDGTASGTRTVGPVLAGGRLENVYGGLASLAGRIYFCSTDNSGRPWSLFSIDEQGIVAEIRPETPAPESCPYPITAAAGRIWFYAIPSSETTSLWTSDGTPAGTLRLAELPSRGSNPIPLGDAVFFVVSPPAFGDTDRGRELWRSDGTVSGTGPWLEIAPPSKLEDSYDLNDYPVATDPVVAGGRLWFAGIDPEHGVELWSTDGTAAGTRRETDLAPGPAWSSPRSLLPVGDKLYFVADDTRRGGIWVLDLD